MQNLKVLPLALIVISALSFAGFALAKGGGHKHSGKVSEHDLRDVMQYLGNAQQEIQTGILVNNRLMIAEGAKAIAHHPSPKGGIAPYIKKDTKKLKETIASMDTLVHGTAIEIFKKSQSAPMLELQNLNAKMTTACIGCHNAFRD